MSDSRPTPISGYENILGSIVERNIRKYCTATDGNYRILTFNEHLNFIFKIGEDSDIVIAVNKAKDLYQKTVKTKPKIEVKVFDMYGIEMACFPDEYT